MQIDYMISLITPIILLYVLMFVIVLGQRYLKIYNKNKILKFTQEEIKEKKKEILNIKNLMVEKSYIGEMSPLDLYENKHFQYAYEIVSLYNELAVGINEGIYDELYVKMIMGNEMMFFYKKYYNQLISSIEYDTIFIPLELLLKKWDSNKGPSYKVKNNRRYI